MTCEQFTAQLSSWLDGTLSPDEAKEMLAHAEQCGDCGALTETMRSMLAHALVMGEAPVPEASAQAWRSAIRQEVSSTTKRTPRSAFWTRFGVVAAALLVLVGLTAFGRSQREGTVVQAQSEVLSRTSSASLGGGGMLTTVEPFPAAAPPEATRNEVLAEEGVADSALLFATDASAQTTRPAGTMLERSAWISLRTQQFDSDSEKLLLLPEQMEGWVERQSLSGQAYESSGEGRHLSLTLRIPEENLDEALATLEGIGTLESRETYAQDISEQYYDTQGRLDSALSLRTQLQALLEKAEDVEVLATLTRELSENQRTIDALQGTLRGWDSRVQYSEVSITLSEQPPGGIAPVQGTSLGSRIAQGFVDSINAVLSFLGDMAVTLVWLLPWLVPIGLIAWLVTWIVRKKRKK